MLSRVEFITPGLEVEKLEYKLKIKRNDWLFADTSANSQSLRFILSLSLYLSFITSRPVSISIFSILTNYGTIQLVAGDGL